MVYEFPVRGRALNLTWSEGATCTPTAGLTVSCPPPVSRAPARPLALDAPPPVRTQSPPSSARLQERSPELVLALRLPPPTRSVHAADFN